MAVPATIDDLISLGHKSGILDRQGLDDYLAKVRQEPVAPASPQELAEALVRDGLLTRFQADQLLRGRWRNFLIGGGKYKLLERLGQGGMGAVFLCEHTSLRRRVALKVLSAEQAKNSTYLERFYREGRAAAALDHPNIIKVHDIDHDGSLHFLVLEYVEGTTLFDLVREKGPLEIGSACQYVYQGALGLQHAHEMGLVHRDVKPSNLLLDRAGTVKLLDLGLARFFHDQKDNLTKEHDSLSVLGTVDYLAPEQAIDSHEADVRADVYGLGCTLYFLLAGTPPFAGGTLHQKLIGHQMRPPEPVSRRRPEVPAELEAVLDRMMAKLPEERFQEPHEAAQALAPWAALAPCSENEGLRSSPAVGLPSSRTGTFLSDTKTAPSEPPAGTPVKPSRPDAIRNGLGAGKAEPPRGLTVGPASGESNVLQQARGRRPRPVDWERYNFYARMALIALILLGSLWGFTWLTFWRNPANPVSAHVTPEDPDKGRNVALAPTKLPRDVVGLLARLEGHGDWVERASITADGRLALTCSTDRTVRLWDLDTGTLVRVFSGHANVVHDVAFSPDGRSALTAGYDNTVRLWDVERGAELRNFAHAAPVHAVAFAPDGRQFVSGSGDRNNNQPRDCVLRLWDLASGKASKFEGHTDAVWSVAFSPDGRRLLSGSYDATVRVWDINSGEEICRFTRHRGTVHMAKFSPDGRLAASASADHTVCVWDAWSGKEVKRLEGHTNIVGAVAFAPDGRHLLSGSEDRTVRLWETKTGQEVARFNVHVGGVKGVCFTPDGTRALSCGGDRTVCVWGMAKSVFDHKAP